MGTSTKRTEEDQLSHPQHSVLVQPSHLKNEKCTNPEHDAAPHLREDYILFLGLKAHLGLSVRVSFLSSLAELGRLFHYALVETPAPAWKLGDQACRRTGTATETTLARLARSRASCDLAVIFFSFSSFSCAYRFFLWRFRHGRLWRPVHAEGPVGTAGSYEGAEPGYGAATQIGAFSCAVLRCSIAFCSSWSGAS